MKPLGEYLKAGKYKNFSCIFKTTYYNVFILKIFS
jgi:hypothetical protein